MNKKEYWQAHVKRNPSFVNEDKRIELSVGMLRRLMEEAFDKGAAHTRPAVNSKVNDNLAEIFRMAGVNPNDLKR